MAPLPILGSQGADRAIQAGRFRLPKQRTNEARLPDPRLARQEQQLAATGCRVGDPAIRQVEQVVAPDEQRAQERRDPAHAPGVRVAGDLASVE